MNAMIGTGKVLILQMKPPSKQNRPDKEKPSLQEQATRITRMLDLPGGTFGGCQIELSGNREAIVDGCTGILEYDENSIRLAAGKLQVRFSGRGLQVRALTHSSAIVEGYILHMDFDGVAE